MKHIYENIPSAPGIYLMKDKEDSLLYVGKAANLKRRVSSYFLRPHEARIEKLVRRIIRIDYIVTDSVIEALILEAEYIKRFKPSFNVKDKDDKSFLYVEVTREVFPRVLLVRGKSKARGVRYGPFTSASLIREALKIVRRIFPFSVHELKSIKNTPGRACFDYEIGLCPGTCTGIIDRKMYLKNIRNIKLFFVGKKERILRSLKKEMESASRKLDFEKAASIRKQVFSLRHIQDVSLITHSNFDESENASNIRIEGYDISNTSGKEAVGSMVVFINGKPAKDQYRKFKIRTLVNSNDAGMLEEVLRRRFKNDWLLPNIILIDGGVPQVNRAHRVLYESGLRIPIVGIAKGPKRKKNEVIGEIPEGTDVITLIRVRNEAHRFSVAYHRRLRRLAF